MAVSEEIQRQVLAEATSANVSFETDYNDERFDKIDQDYEADLNELEGTYGGMIGNVDGYYKDLENALQNQADKSAQIQQDNTDFAIEKIEQQKDQANKDYIKEQSGAYVDWQKQSNKYGVEAEKIAAAGLDKSGFSESSQVGMYNTYQNRVATARETLSRVILEYNNNIKEAQLQNNAALAQIYADLSVKQIELALQGFQYKNQLVLDLADKKQQLKDNKWQKELAIIQQQNTENELAWDAWKYNDEKAWQTEQAELDRQHELQRDKINQEFEVKLEGIKHDYEIKYLNAKTAKEKELAKQAYDLEVKKAEQEQKDKLALLDKELDNAKKLAKYESELNSSAIKGSGGGSSVVKAGTTAAKKATSSATISNSSSAKAYAVNTAYYQGAKNPDASKYGTFSNGYQPKGISGHGTLSKTGQSITIKTQTLSGQKQTVVQNVWKAEDGTKWYWEGRQNKYIQIK